MGERERRKRGREKEMGERDGVIEGEKERREIIQVYWLSMKMKE